MTELRNYFNNYETNYSTFGGIIYSGDFDAHHTISDIADRIASDMRFDRVCKKNIEGREWKKEHAEKLR